MENKSTLSLAVFGHNKKLQKASNLDSSLDEIRINAMAEEAFHGIFLAKQENEYILQISENNFLPENSETRILIGYIKEKLDFIIIPLKRDDFRKFKRIFVRFPIDKYKEFLNNSDLQSWREWQQDSDIWGTSNFASILPGQVMRLRSIQEHLSGQFSAKTKKLMAVPRSFDKSQSDDLFRFLEINKAHTNGGCVGLIMAISAKINKIVLLPEKKDENNDWKDFLLQKPFIETFASCIKKSKK